MFALQTIIIVIFVSGFIAFVGDRVGHFIGKKRLTIFNLRPRTTGVIITIITGITIAVFTGLVLSILSADVRTAIFGLNKLKQSIETSNKELKQLKTDKTSLIREISELKNMLEKYKKEINVLQETKQKLSKEVATTRKGQLLYNVGDVIITTVIDLGNKEDIKAKLSYILLNTDAIIKESIGGKRDHYITMPENELEEAVNFLSDKKGSAVVRLISASNVVFGEEIPVHFEIFENRLVFKKGEIIAFEEITPSNNSAEIEEKIKVLLSKVNEISIEKGMIPNPDGTVGTIPYSKIFEATKTIKSSKKIVKVNIIASKDTFSSGPLEIDLQIKN